MRRMLATLLAAIGGSMGAAVVAFGLMVANTILAAGIRRVANRFIEVRFGSDGRVPNAVIRGT